MTAESAAAAGGAGSWTRRTTPWWRACPRVTTVRPRYSSSATNGESSASLWPSPSDRATAEDVAQEAFVRAWRHAAVFDPRRASATSWLSTITRNLAIDTLRLRRATPIDPDDAVWFVAADAGTGPDAQAEHVDAMDRVRAAFEGRSGRTASGPRAIGVLRPERHRDRRCRGHPGGNGQEPDPPRAVPAAQHP